MRRGLIVVSTDSDFQRIAEVEGLAVESWTDLPDPQAASDERDDDSET
jgi:hypothetical protein